MRIILLFGDSILFGKGIERQKSYCSKLAQSLSVQDKYNDIVYNLGTPGESTNELLKRLDFECRARIPNDFPRNLINIILAIGINDAKAIQSPDNVNTLKETFLQNIEKLIKIAQKYTKRIIFLGLAPVNEKLALSASNCYFLNEKIKQYNDVLRDVCLRGKVDFIDMFDTFNKNFDRNFLAEDGIHLNELGHQEIFENLTQYIKINESQTD